MRKKDEIRETLAGWFKEDPLADFAGVLVYAKTSRARGWVNRLALAADAFHYRKAVCGEGLAASAQPEGWDKAVLIGKSSDLDQALRLVGLPGPKSSVRRKFTDVFGLGDRVAVIRTRHGWHDGDLIGVITDISDYRCRVKEIPQHQSHMGGEYDIDHVRDLILVEKNRKTNIRPMKYTR